MKFTPIEKTMLTVAFAVIISVMTARVLVLHNDLQEQLAVTRAGMHGQQLVIETLAKSIDDLRNSFKCVEPPKGADQWQKETPDTEPAPEEQSAPLEPEEPKAEARRGAARQAFLRASTRSAISPTSTTRSSRADSTR